MNEYHLDPSNYPLKWNENEGIIKIEISAKINESESKEKLMRAVKNIFPNLKTVITSENMVLGNSDDVKVLFDLFKSIFEMKILDVARKCALDGIILKENGESTNKTILYLNKQIAFINKINFGNPNDSPLGPISITIECKNLDLFIDTYFPKFEWFSIKDLKTNLT